MYKVEYGGGAAPRSKTFRRLWLAEEFARENGPSVVFLDQGAAAAAPRYVPIRRYLARSAPAPTASEKPGLPVASIGAAMAE